MASYDRDIDCSCSSLLSIPWLCGVSYALYLMPSLLQCGLDVFCLMWLSCPRYSPLRSSACLRIWGLQPLLFRVFCIALWVSLSGLHASWDSLSSFLSLRLGSGIVGRIVWPFIVYPLLGLHPCMSIVRWVVIGYCCNHLDGQLNYWTTYWLISVVTNVKSVDVLQHTLPMALQCLVVSIRLKMVPQVL